jgi:hypothetical protein
MEKDLNILEDVFLAIGFGYMRFVNGKTKLPNHEIGPIFFGDAFCIE